MGGSLLAAALIYQLATAKPILEPWGYGLLAATLLTASFFAWKEEYQKAQTAVADAPHVEITGTYAFAGSPAEHAPPFLSVAARLANPGREAVSFKPDWTLDVTTADGKRAEGLHGSLRGEIRPLQQGDQFNILLYFPYVPGVTDVASLTGATMVLTVTDLRGRVLRSEFVNSPQPRAS